MTAWPDLASLGLIDLALVGDLAPEDTLTRVHLHRLRAYQLEGSIGHRGNDGG